MRLSLVARFKTLSIVTKLMDFRVNGTFVQILQIKYYKRLTEKSRPHYIFFCANFNNLYTFSLPKSMRFSQF